MDQYEHERFPEDVSFSNLPLIKQAVQAMIPGIFNEISGSSVAEIGRAYNVRLIMMKREIERLQSKGKGAS